jgi:hypothetical protein
MSRLLTVELVLLLAVSSVVLVGSASAVTPSVPEFSLRIVAYPYDVAPVYSTNNYTGQQVLDEDGYHVQNRSVEIVIKNQPFTTFKDNNGNWYSLYYNVSYKPHLAEEWDYLYVGGVEKMLQTYNADYSVFTYNIDDSSFSRFSPVGGQIDFRVQASIGFYTYYRDAWYFMDTYSIIFSGTTSHWSLTQTIEIPVIGSEGTPEPTSNTTPPQAGTQTNGSAGLGWQNGLIVVLAVTVVGLVVALETFWRKLAAVTKKGGAGA